MPHIPRLIRTINIGYSPADINNVKIEPVRLNRTSLQGPQESPAVSRQRFTNQEALGPAETIALPPFKVGQELSATIMGALDDSRLILNIGGALLEANNPGGLAPGQTVRLRVDFLEPQVMLHIVEQEPTIESEASSLLRQRLPGLTDQDKTLTTFPEKLVSSIILLSGTTPRSTLEKLRSFVADILDNQQPLSPERLMQFVRDSGLHYESKLFRAIGENSSDLAAIADRDLKGLLLGALKDLEAGAGGGVPRRAIVGQLDHLEIQQAVNLLAQLEGQPLQIRLPFFTGAGFTDVALAVQRDGQGRGEVSGEAAQEYTLMFLLDLDNFGRMRIEAHLKAQDLRVIFYVDREESAALLRQEMPAFAATLKAVGYREVLLAAKTTKKMPAEQQHRFDALALGVPPNIQLLNVKV